MKKLLLTFNVTLLFALILVACGPSATSTEALKGKVWVLTQIDYSATGQTLKPASSASLTLEFKDDNTVAGNGGCNTFGGSFEVSNGNALQIKNVFSTLMACENMDIEAAYFDALGKANAFNVQSDQLQLTTSDSSATLTFVVQKP